MSTLTGDLNAPAMHVQHTRWQQVAVRLYLRLKKWSPTEAL
jgi:hypothetical protein